MIKGFRAVLLLLIVALLAIGFYRLRLGVDIFELLPGDSLMARGLRLYQNSFGTSRELILSVQAPDAQTAENAARSLAEAIEKSRLSLRVIWQNPLAANPQARAELLAYYWFNQPPAQVGELVNNLQGERLRRRLETAKEQMAVSYQPQEIARLGYDPLGLSQIPSEAAGSAFRSNGNPFTGESGKFRILMVDPPFEAGGFWTIRRWTQTVRQTVHAWQVQHQRFSSVVVRVTGTPAFISQTGSGLMSDMQTAAIGTLLFVSALFWMVHRHFRPLIWLAALLVFILLITIGWWGLFFCEVHAVSLGFAAILLGLSADYGLILFQEYRADPGQSVRHHLAAVAPSIFWAAGTTAAAFLIMGRSSLPGMRQLGLLVGIGILVAAVVMTSCYLQTSAVRADAGKKKKPLPIPGNPARLYRPRTSLGITIVLAAISAVLLYRQPPTVDYGTRNLGPRANPVRETLEEIQRRIGGYNASLWIIASGANLGQVSERLRADARMLEHAVQAGILESYILPVEIWPHPQYQQENRERVLRMLDRFPQIEEAVLDAGFSEESLKLARQVFAFWKQFAAQEGLALPTQPASQWVFNQFAAENSGQQLALGRLSAAPDASESELLRLARDMYSETGSLVFGWSLLSESLSGLIKRDIMRVLIPICIVVLILLATAFRKPGEILLSLATIAFSLLVLLACMALGGWSWNLMNIMALPLLFGAGVDYSIHIQFALRRFGGDLPSVRRTVVKAILLCGISTASGFGSLAFASNVGMASLGRVCALGIVIISLTAAFLLPVWWRLLKRVS